MVIRFAVLTNTLSAVASLFFLFFFKKRGAANGWPYEVQPSLII